MKFTESGNSQTSPKPAFCNRFLTLDDQLITVILLSMVLPWSIKTQFSFLFWCNYFKVTQLMVMMMLLVERYVGHITEPKTLFNIQKTVLLNPLQMRNNFPIRNRGARSEHFPHRLFQAQKQRIQERVYVQWTIKLHITVWLVFLYYFLKQQ